VGKISTMHRQAKLNARSAPGDKGIGYIVGAGVFIVSIVVCKLLGIPQYIRPAGLYGCVLAGILYVHFEKHGSRLWFWVTILIITACHIAVFIRFIQQIDDASPLLTIPLAMLDGILIVVLIVYLGVRFEKRVKR